MEAFSPSQGQLGKKGAGRWQSGTNGKKAGNIVLAFLICFFLGKGGSTMSVAIAIALWIGAGALMHTVLPRAAGAESDVFLCAIFQDGYQYRSSRIDSA